MPKPGKTRTPLVIVVAPQLLDSPDFVALAEQGHKVRSMDHVSLVIENEVITLSDVDLILGPTARWYIEKMAGMGALDKALKAAKDTKKGAARREKGDEAQ